MNAFNRAVVTAAAAAVLLMSATALMVALGVVDHRFPPWIPNDESRITPTPPELNGNGAPTPQATPVEQIARPDTWLETELRALSEMNVIQKGATAIAVLAIIGITAFLIKLEVINTEGKRGANLLISDSENGTTTVDSKSIQALAEATGGGNGQVNSITCRMRVKKPGPPQGPDRLEIICRPHLRMGANLESVTDDLQTRIKEAVENSTGLVVEKVHLSGVRFDPLDRGRMLEIPERRSGRI